MSTQFSQDFNGVDDALTPDGATISAGALFNGGLYTHRHADTVNALSATLTLSGSDWLMRSMIWTAGAGADYDVTLTDATVGAARVIDQLVFAGAGTVTATLANTQTRFILGTGDNFDLTLGATRVISVDLSGTTNTVQTGTGAVGHITLSGTNQVTVSTAVDVLALDGGSAHQVAVEANGLVRHLSYADAALDLDIATDGRVKSVSASGADADVDLATGARLDRVTLSNADLDIDLRKDALIKTIDVEDVDSTMMLRGTGRVNTFVADGGTVSVQAIGSARLVDAVIDEASGSLTLQGASRLGNLTASGSDLTITAVGDDARLGRASVSNGVYNIETDAGFVEVISVTNAALTASLGGGAALISIAAGNAKRAHTITSEGYVELISVTEASSASDNQSTTLTLNGGAGAVTLGHGRDVVTLANSYVDSIETGGGNDQINHGGDGVGNLSLGGGKDVLFLRAMEAADAIVADGGAGGADVANFSKITSGVTVSLADTGPQNISAADIGVVTLTRFESLTGTAKADTLTGDDQANRLVGGRGRDELKGAGGADHLNGGNGSDRLVGDIGRDTLIGGSGGDTLIGGGGNDQMSGGGGADLFVFTGLTNTDRITDFTQGADRLRLRSEDGFDALSFSAENGDLKITHSNGVIWLEDRGDLVLDAGDFLFG